MMSRLAVDHTERISSALGDPTYVWPVTNAMPNNIGAVTPKLRSARTRSWFEQFARKMTSLSTTLCDLGEYQARFCLLDFFLITEERFCPAHKKQEAPRWDAPPSSYQQPGIKKTVPQVIGHGLKTLPKMGDRKEACRKVGRFAKPADRHSRIANGPALCCGTSDQGSIIEASTNEESVQAA